jgi:hypothetical protein
MPTEREEADRAGRLDEIKNLVLSSAYCDVDRRYSDHYFYVVERPDVEERLAALQPKSQVNKEK